ncbi:hypothetical protein Cgig2_014128 [Carnegiea gigantea]|uniref:Ty3 transposon capsid-like protein domain-containing protein n=1 Tax=Carnegiea gigantea TaxID=171969 RepID=A0A9Q1Q9Q8_9CARY|nr:hypothetical protein Cgig2_014128 [Carnegiea gigantea]
MPGEINEREGKRRLKDDSDPNLATALCTQKGNFSATLPHLHTQALDQTIQRNDELARAGHARENRRRDVNILPQLRPLEDRFNNGGGLEMIPRNNLHFNPKVEFPCFDGKDRKGWIKKCTRYFGLCRINEDQKVHLVTLHFKGPAEIWFGSYIMGRRNVTWDEFIVHICSRFRDNYLGSKVVDFDKLHQTGSLDNYLVKFEELKALLLVRNLTMSDTYFLESFITRLTAAVKPPVRAFNLQTVSAAMDYAKYQKEAIQALKITPDRTPKSLPIHSKPTLPTPASFAKTILNTSDSYKSPINSQNFQKPPKFIPASERAEKMAKGLCYYCDQPFERRHKCGNKGK